MFELLASNYSDPDKVNIRKYDDDPDYENLPFDYKEPLQANRYFMMLKEWELKKSQALYFDGTIAYHYECDYEENWHAYSKGWHRRYGPKKIDGMREAA